MKFNPNFPTNEKFREIDNEILWNTMRENISNMYSENLFDNMVHRSPMNLLDILYNKIFSIELSYKCVNFYYKNGFDDISINFVKTLTEEEFSRKLMFDYFIEHGLYAISSTYEIIGHILFVKFKLELKKKERISYSKALEKIKVCHEDIWKELDNCKNSSVNIRNKFTHNTPPTELLPFLIQWDDKSIEVKEGKSGYKSAKELYDKFNLSINNLNETLKILLKYI